MNKIMAVSTPIYFTLTEPRMEIPNRIVDFILYFVNPSGKRIIWWRFIIGILLFLIALPFLFIIMLIDILILRYLNVPKESDNTKKEK